MNIKKRKHRKAHYYSGLNGPNIIQSTTPNFTSMVNTNPAAGLKLPVGDFKSPLGFNGTLKLGTEFLNQYGGAAMGGLSSATGLVSGVMGALNVPSVQQIAANGINYGISNDLYTDYSKNAKNQKNQLIQDATSEYFNNFTSGLEDLNEMTIDMNSAKDSIKASNFSGNSTSDLMNQWNNTSMYNVNDYMDYYDELDEQRADYQNSIYDSRLDYLNNLEYQDETTSLGKYGVGKALGNIGSMAASGASLGSVIPGVGTLIGGAVGAIGGAISSIFGANKQRKKEKERQRVEDLKESIYNEEKAGTIDELASMQQATADLRAEQRADTLNTFTDLINNTNKQTTLNFNNAVNNANRNSIYSLLASTYANGGKLDNNFTNGVTIISNGGTHEENPNEGVQMGIASDGLPNLVEEGEVIFNNYVYSDRLSPNKDMRKKNKYKGKSFADIAKYLQKESEERPNDPISKRGLEDGLMRLANNQELIRQEKEANKMKRKYARGGKLGILYDGTGKKSNTLYNPYSNYVDIADDWYSTGGLSYYDYVNRLKDIASNTTRKGESTSVTKRNNEILNKYINDLNAGKYGDIGNNKFSINDIEGLQRLATDSKRGPVHEALLGAFKEMNTNPASIVSESSLHIPSISYAPINLPKNTSYTPSSKDTKSRNGLNFDASILRYAPAVGSGVGALMASFSDPDYTNANLIGNIDLAEGIDFDSLSPSDYFKYLTQTKANANTVGAETISDYLSYNPLDTNYTLNKMNQQAAATRRAIMNTSGGNSAAARAALLAADYNAQNAVGEALRQDAQYNQAMKERMAAFNRGTNQYNADAVTRAAMANQQAKNSIELANAQMEAQRKQALVDAAYRADNMKMNKAQFQAGINQNKLQQAAQVAAMRNQIENTYNQNKSTAWSNFLSDLGNIGNEAVQQGWMDRLIDSGALKFDNGGYLLTKPKRKRRRK